MTAHVHLGTRAAHAAEFLDFLKRFEADVVQDRRHYGLLEAASWPARAPLRMGQRLVNKAER